MRPIDEPAKAFKQGPQKRELGPPMSDEVSTDAAQCGHCK